MKKTHLGSMPFLDINTSISWAKKFDLITLPELVIRDQSQLMINRARECLRKKNGFHAFSNLLDHFDEKEIKIHCAGPLTCSMLGEFSIDLYMDLIYQASEQLKNRYDKLWICLDEPSLNFVNINESTKIRYKTFLNSFESKIGIHCCDKVSLDQLFPEHINFLSISAFKCDINEFLTWKNGELIIGSINAINGEQSTSHIPSKDVFISPDCGLGTIDENLANNILKCLFELS